MVRIFLLLSLCSVLFLVGCSPSTGLNLGYYPDPQATPQKFIHCHGYGCAQKTYVGFNAYQWKKIRKIFKKKSKNAKSERDKIAKAIALMEKYVGELDGTKDDLPKAPIVRTSDTELDCIDETVNTIKYLKFLQSDDLLKWHGSIKPVHKGYFINGVYPHNSAAIEETATGIFYVVDSYIFKNGEEPVIRTLKDWLSYTTFESEEY